MCSNKGCENLLDKREGEEGDERLKVSDGGQSGVQR
jgi:hypothetical protein